MCRDRYRPCHTHYENACHHGGMLDTHPETLLLAIAIADAPVLRSLLWRASPPLATIDTLGHVRAQVQVPWGDGVVDALLHYDIIHCLMPPIQSVDAGWNAQDYRRHTCFETAWQPLVDSVAITIAIEHLTAAGLSLHQATLISRQPASATSKAWWYGPGNQPFLRAIRTIHFSDGNLSLHYKDYFGHKAPPCFHRETQLAVIVLRQAGETFVSLVRRAQALQPQPVIIVGTTSSAIEAQALVQQGFHLYPAAGLPQIASCERCQLHSCSWQGNPASPVQYCHAMRLDL